jgi:hypothetical protein
MVKKRMILVWTIALILVVTSTAVTAEPVSMARLQYEGGGDWYNNPDVIPNLLEFVHRETGIPVEPEQTVVRSTDEALFNHPILYVTGHGNISLSDEEARSLRNYALSGGFIYIDDDYGMDEYVRDEIRAIFPDRSLRRLSFDHPVLDHYYSFEDLPRIHEHYPDEAPAAYGIKADGQWVLLYTYNTNISDGWASPEVHEDPPEIRRAALRMGTNLVTWILSQ